MCVLERGKHSPRDTSEVQSCAGSCSIQTPSKCSEQPTCIRTYVHTCVLYILYSAMCRHKKVEVLTSILGMERIGEQPYQVAVVVVFEEQLQ